MTPERWQQINDLYHSSLEREPRERAAFIAQACDGDEDLRQEIESLINSHEQDDGFIEQPVAGVVARLLIAEHTNSMTGVEIGHYQILNDLGSGGMGEVYLAHDSKLNRQVAIKLLPNRFTLEADRVRRFQQEARAASALNHPNILTIYEIAEVENRPYIVAEFIDGQTLRQVIANGGLKLGEALDVAIQITSALTAAHAAGITHRDIKPENIMLRPDGYVKVLDFGLAKLMTDLDVPEFGRGGATQTFNTDPGLIMGTVKYMSPEQAQGHEVDNRTDIWSLCAVLYEMISGSAPFEGTTPSHVTVSILEKKPAPLRRCASQVPAELEWIISKGLRKDREERYQTAKDILVDLRYFKQQLELSAELERSVGTETLSAASDARIQTETERLKKTSGSLSNESIVSAGKRKFTNSLAVLPLTNASDDPNAEYLSDGITESIINSLSCLPKLRVVPRSTVFRYKGKEMDPRQIGQELSVRAVLTGRLLQLGDRLIIKTELIDVLNDSQLWGEQYNRRLSDILELEEEISREISEKLRIKLTGEDKKRLTKRHTKNTDAYQAYLKGRYYWNRRTPESLQKAIQSFEAATRADSNYAPAYSGLADCYALLNYYGIFSSQTTRPKATTAADRALKADEGLAEAHESVALVGFWFDWEWVRAQVEFERALKLNPGYAAAHQWYCWYLAAMGKFEQAEAEGQRALELDPLAPTINLALAKYYFFAHRYDDTIKQCKRTLELEPNFIAGHYFLGQAYVQKGRFNEAIAAYERGLQVLGDLPLGRSVIAHARALGGDKAAAEQTLSSLLDGVASTDVYVPAHGIALIHAGLGNKDEAIEWLHKAYDERFVWLAYLNVDPVFDSLRDETRFKELIARMQFDPPNHPK
jgi:serine/threonine protein kinase/cytochrome c-type biogenesis protein CcmH/NrfG